MDNNIFFYDYGRQKEIEMFYDCSQRYRDYYRGYPKAYHPLSYFDDPAYDYQCPREMTDDFPIVCNQKFALWSLGFVNGRYVWGRLPSDLPPPREKPAPKPLLFSRVYLSYPPYHVKYKQPIVLPNNIGRTTPIPAAPDRTLAGRYNKAACQRFVR